MKLSRRTFLRGTGVTLALPALDVMGAAKQASPKCLVAINLPLGFMPEYFFPKGTGTNYKLSPYLQLASALRQDFTVFSGISHPSVDGGHAAEKSFLTAAPHPGSRSFKNSISLDQFAAKRMGGGTRYSYLSLGNTGLSWSANGVPIPQEKSPSKAFARLFLAGTKSEVAAQRQRLDDEKSILDVVLSDAKSMQGRVSRTDRDKLDQYFTAVRETEKELHKSESWIGTPKPKIVEKQPKKFANADFNGRMRAHFQVMRLALQTDSTRVIAYGGANGGHVPPIKGVSEGYHPLSHHGKNPKKMEQLAHIERDAIQAWAEFIVSLKETKVGNGTLLDATQVLLGSNMGNASGHTTKNLPVVLAGGAFKHGQHLAFDTVRNYPLPNLFVSMLQGLDLPVDQFASSTSTLTGLQLKG